MTTTTATAARNLRADDIISMRGLAVTITNTRVSGSTVWFTTDRFGTDYLPADAIVRVIR